MNVASLSVHPRLLCSLPGMLSVRRWVISGVHQHPSVCWPPAPLLVIPASPRPVLRRGRTYRPVVDNLQAENGTENPVIHVCLDPRLVVYHQPHFVVDSLPHRATDHP